MDAWFAELLHRLHRLSQCQMLFAGHTGGQSQPDAGALSDAGTREGGMQRGWHGAIQPEGAGECRLVVATVTHVTCYAGVANKSMPGCCRQAFYMLHCRCW
jgi:hypothetical protein